MVKTSQERMAEELMLALSAIDVEVAAAVVSAARRPAWWSRMIGVFRGMVL